MADAADKAIVTATVVRSVLRRVIMTFPGFVPRPGRTLLQFASHPKILLLDGVICISIWEEIMRLRDRVGKRIKLQDMRVLMTVAQAGSMGKAARDLNTSQPN